MVKSRESEHEVLRDLEEHYLQGRRRNSASLVATVKSLLRQITRHSAMEGVSGGQARKRKKGFSWSASQLLLRAYQTSDSDLLPDVVCQS